MITQIDKTKIDSVNKNLRFRENLEQFVDDVALLKPRAKFAIDNDCVATDYVINETTNQYDRNPCIYRVKVYEGGEELGSISVFDEYRKGIKTHTYGVESFRINKFRGRGNTTSSMHKKVALTNVKKNLVARVKDELVEQIGNNVKQRLNGLTSGAESSMTWTVNQIDIAKDYAIAAYHARLAGSGEVVLDASKSKYCNNIKHLDKTAATYLDFKVIDDMPKNKRGYGVQGYTDGSFAVLSFATQDIAKYSSIDEMPQEMAEKLSMFKLIGVGEPYPHLGVKLLEHLYFIVDGKTIADA